MGIPTEVMDSLMQSGILLFNLLVGAIDSVVTFLVYKTVSRFIIHGEPLPAKQMGTAQKPQH